MSKLQSEIKANKTKVKNKNTKNKELIDSLLDTVSGGWVNAFANWTKQF